MFVDQGQLIIWPAVEKREVSQNASGCFFSQMRKNIVIKSFVGFAADFFFHAGSILTQAKNLLKPIRNANPRNFILTKNQPGIQLYTIRLKASIYKEDNNDTKQTKRADPGLRDRLHQRTGLCPVPSGDQPRLRLRLSPLRPKAPGSAGRRRPDQERKQVTRH